MDVRLGQAFQEGWEKMGGWVEGLVNHLPNILAAVLVLVLFWFAAKAVRLGILRVVDRTTDHQPVKDLVGAAAYLAVLLTGLLVALGILELDRTVTSVLAGVGIIGLALGFAFQDIAENFISGVLISVRRPFTDGDIIETNEHMGVVERVDLRSTLIRTFQGQMVRVPNRDVYGNPLVNYTALGSRRVDLKCGVSYGDDLEKTRRVALEAVRRVPGRDPERDVEVFYEEFGGSSINFVVRFWIPFRRQTDFLRARSEAIQSLKRALDEEGLTIPFPITTLDFGIAGGRALSEELRRSGVE